MASDYTPAAEGIPQYFLPMLDDRDRNLKYHAAITAAIRQFKAEQRRPPRVLDVGVGTGMLSAICLEAGCASVTGLDTNETMCHLADLHLGKLRSRGGGSFQVVHCPGGKAPAWFAGRRFDMLVSEILGTLTTSESMLKYLTKYARAHLDVFVDEATGERRVYAVPQRTAQHYASYAFPRADLGPTLSAVLEATLEAAAGRFLPTNDGGLGLGLHLYPRERVGPRRTFYEEDYTRWPFSHSHAHSKPEPLQLHAPPGGRLLEWDVTLWGRGDGAVGLSNSLDGYEAFGASFPDGGRNGFARAAAWGFFAMRLPQPVPRATGAPKLQIARLNGQTSAKPKITVDGVEYHEVLDDPQPQLAMAADTALPAAYLRALAAAADGERGRGRRLLIVNDISCGAIAVQAAAWGWQIMVEEGGRAQRSRHPLPGRFDAILFPSLLLDVADAEEEQVDLAALSDTSGAAALAAEKGLPAGWLAFPKGCGHYKLPLPGAGAGAAIAAAEPPPLRPVVRLAEAEAIVGRYLAPGGVRLPPAFDVAQASASVERVVATKRASKATATKRGLDMAAVRTVRGDNNLVTSTLHLLDLSDDLLTPGYRLRLRQTRLPLADGVEVDSSVDALRRMAYSADPAERRVAAARATYHGFSASIRSVFAAPTPEGGGAGKKRRQAEAATPVAAAGAEAEGAGAESPAPVAPQGMRLLLLRALVVGEKSREAIVEHALSEEPDRRRDSSLHIR
ncbi:hypothetical protein EMIHUDRAFT_230580 [Emiliania huxleyi CCMP1516]|uniref:Methyltransferase domain-containing protein n=2 Tax=Emiliania huxleyi TaxID=2903 RepID=A0A0D3KA34_EMIH1|nr:hypothetical protein EMIHUDRAFT_230580 [Emiliania huxleyi CCMP1516]EOD32619.1 hypothetical protein EMIHUDRAFT_230580 [Emiliania huxleyi CCMP1516]|eukprot:XP_005785048.1 hypothetical protein EMIHUDRAFT_230580 [Emiliania huxleyi CCMP1516]